MKLIIWLGNPWEQYKNTRHNVGFIMIDSFFSEWKEEKKFKSMISNNFLILGSWVVGVKPDTCMNVSGDAVSALVSFYKLDPKKDILVISDDIDMDFAKVRFRSMWSHGGQNWLRDIITKLWTNEFARIKIGIGRNAAYDISNWVLSRFTSEETKLLQDQTVEQVKKYINIWLWD